MSSKIRILIADDDPDDALMLAEGLSEVIGNFEVTNASDGRQCLRLLQDGCNPDLVFMDVNMPLKDGLECLRDIQQLQVADETPIIMYSTSQNVQDINAANRLGARFYLVKPTSFSMLKKLLNHTFKMLGKSRREQAGAENFLIEQRKVCVAQ